MTLPRLLIACLLACLSLPATAQERARLTGPETGPDRSWCTGCCRDGHADKVCVRKFTWTVPEAGSAPDALAPAVVLHQVSGQHDRKAAQKLYEKAGRPLPNWLSPDRNQFYGAADEKNRILVKPDKFWLMPVSSRHAVLDDGLLDMKSGKVKPWSEQLPKPDVFLAPTQEQRGEGGRRLTLVQHPAIISTVKRAADNQLGEIAFLDTEGNVLTTIPDVVLANGKPAVSRLGKQMVVTTRTAATGELSSLFTTMQGQVLSAGGPISGFCVRKTARESQVRMIGELADAFDPANRALYQPLDAAGNLVSLTGGVLGMLPIRNARERNLDCASGWVIVELHGPQLKYRIGSGLADEVLAKRNTLGLLSNLQAAPALDFSGTAYGNLAPFWHQYPTLVAQREKDGAWLLTSLSDPQITDDTGGSRPADGQVSCKGFEWAESGGGPRIAGYPPAATQVCIGSDPATLISGARAYGDEQRLVVAAVNKRAMEDGIRGLAAEQARKQAAQQAAQQQVGNATSWTPEAYQAAVQLGGGTFVNFIDRFGARSAWDVEAYCRYGGTRCNALRSQSRADIERSNREAAARNQQRLWDVYKPSSAGGSSSGSRGRTGASDIGPDYRWENGKLIHVPTQKEVR